MIGNGLFILPKQFYLSFITIAVTLGPALFQLLYNNRIYVDIKRELLANPDLAKDQSLKDDPEATQNSLTIHNTIYSILLFLSLLMLIITCLTDPGIIPRGSDDKITFLY